MRTSNYPNECQVYGVDASGNLTHAGTRNVRRINGKTARRIERKWRAWKLQYLRNNPGDYPLRSTLPSAKLCIHPVMDPDSCQWFSV